jgi:hypothetical protein
VYERRHLVFESCKTTSKNPLSRYNLSVSGRWCNLSATSAIGALAISIKSRDSIAQERRLSQCLCGQRMDVKTQGALRGTRLLSAPTNSSLLLRTRTIVVAESDDQCQQPQTHLDRPHVAVAHVTHGLSSLKEIHTAYSLRSHTNARPIRPRMSQMTKIFEY